MGKWTRSKTHLARVRLAVRRGPEPFDKPTASVLFLAEDKPQPLCPRHHPEVYLLAGYGITPLYLEHEVDRGKNNNIVISNSTAF